MNKENINYSPISVIDCEKLIIKDCIDIDVTKFSGIENYVGYPHFLINSDICKYDDKLYCSAVMMKKNRCFKEPDEYYFLQRKINNLYGIIPTIPYKLVSKIAKLNDNGLYELGHYPQDEFDYISFSLSFAAGVSRPITYEEKQKFGEKEWECFKDICDSIKPIEYNESKYMKPVLGESFSYPKIEDNKVVVKNVNAYKIKDRDGNEIKVVLRGGSWYKIEPVEWIKYGEYLVCTKILFNCPVHMKNDYVKNDVIQSLDDTFLKWYIDNVFTQDLFKYVDLSFMKEKILIGIEEDIDLKLREIERLKQMKANLMLQQQSEEYITDIAHKNITSLFESDNKNEETTTFHK